MNVTTNAAPLNTDTSGWVTVTTDELLANWGEGRDRAEAIAGLARSLRNWHEFLHREASLSTELAEQRDLLCGLVHGE